MPQAKINVTTVTKVEFTEEEILLLRKMVSMSNYMIKDGVKSDFTDEEFLRAGDMAAFFNDLDVRIASLKEQVGE